MAVNFTIRVAHSPDADDRFFFWPIKHGLVKDVCFKFEFFEADTATLNDYASRNQVDVCAISAIHYARVARQWQPLLAGASFGDGYGPVLLTKTERTLAPELCKNYTLLCPGESTTAYAVLSLLGFHFADVITIPISPMEAIFERLVELPDPVAALVIHEGRLTYASRGLYKVLDIGAAWKDQFGDLLPLGINVISRKLPIRVRRKVAALLLESCWYALRHKDVFVEQERQSGLSPLSDVQLRHYLDLYANSDGARLGVSEQKAFDRLISFWTTKQNQPAIMADWI